MLLLLAAFVTAADEPAAEVRPSRNAQASVVIVRPAVLRFEDIEQRSPELLRDSSVRSPDGALQRARLVEFQ